jgi:UDP-N-acetylmuramate dehydrogenase
MNMAEIDHIGTPARIPVSADTAAAAGLRGIDRFDVPMRKHVSWRAGGHARRFYTPADLDDLCAFMRTLDVTEPLLMIGLGSNLLVRDGGFTGTVVLLHSVLGALELVDGAGSSGRLRAQAGVACPKVARFAAVHGYEGAEFLAGIPGTVGGALAMNAGCYGSQTWERVEQVRLLGRSGEVFERTPDAFDVGYRHVELREAGRLGETVWFIDATLRLDAGDGERSRARIKELLSRRIASQPLQQPNAGSVFRNPQGDHAARLIESCGLKGFAIGGAEVSRKHANFIVNTGTATAADIEAVIDQVQAQVKAQTGVELVREVRIVGERAR